MTRNPAPRVADAPDGARDAIAGEEHQVTEGWGSFLRVIVLAVLGVALFRSFVFAPFTIPSESMLPRLMVGDYIVAAKWPYGYSRLSLPFDAPLIDGRIFARLPERGDVVIFRHPVDGTDYVKRVIGLPGDTVMLRGGQVILNGRPLDVVGSAPQTVRVSPNTTCHAGAIAVSEDGSDACAYRSSTETLPSGRSYPVIDLGPSPWDDYGPITVPTGRLFVMGDNRDNSMDSRFPAAADGGVGLVPTELLIGRASMVLFSSDGSARWLEPWTWFSAVRWTRIGDTL